MYRFVVLLLLLSLSYPSISATREVVTQRPYYNPYYGAYYGGDYVPNYRYSRRNSSAFPDINDLERYAMNRNFTKDSDRTRLERLEMLSFGAVQQGDMLARYDNVRNAILSRPKQNYKTTFLRNISDYFNGQLTGFTPTLNQSDFENYNFGRSSQTNFITPYGKGYKTNNYGIGNDAGVRILD